MTFMCFRKRSNSGLWIRWWICGLHEIRGHFVLSEQLKAPLGDNGCI